MDPVILFPTEARQMPFYWKSEAKKALQIVVITKDSRNNAYI
jgi:hypothetical protein